MHLQVRRLLAVCAFSFVVVASVATSPPRSPPFGLDAELSDSLFLTPAAPRVTRNYTARLNAAGNGGITDGGLPLVATLRLSGRFSEFVPLSRDGGVDGGLVDGGELDAGKLDAGLADAGEPDAGARDAGSMPRNAFALEDDTGRVVAFARFIGLTPNGSPVDAESVALFVGCPANSACEQQVTVELALDPSANATAVLLLEATAASGALSPVPDGARLTLTTP